MTLKWWKKKDKVVGKLQLPRATDVLDLNTWKASPQLVAWTAKQFTDPLFLNWFNMLRNEMPLIYPGGVVTPVSQVAVNIIPGYQRCLEVMASSSKYVPLHSHEEPPMNYPDPTEDLNEG